MSKEVKRFTIGTFHAAIVSAGSECVLASDYDALLAERDRLREALIYARKEAVYGLNHAKTHLQASAALGRISGGTDHALQGAQP